MAAEWVEIGYDAAHRKRERQRARELRQSEWWRRQLAAGRCHYCGGIFAAEALTMDHVVPVARGGRSVKGNVVPSCLECNRAKRYLTPAEQALAALEPASNIVLRAGNDNLIHLIRRGTVAVVVDPGEAAPVLERLRGERLRLEAILLTHHHGDHTGGCDELREKTGCSLLGPAECADLGLDRVLQDGDSVVTEAATFNVLATPGHTAGHIVFHSPALEGVWSGDTLFGAGCGRPIECDAERLWQSLLELRALPPATRLWCGHDYTLDNLDFALSILPHDLAFARRRASTLRLLARARPPVGANLREECRSNIFLRADSASLAEALHLHSAASSLIFATLRSLKDKW